LPPRGAIIEKITGSVILKQSGKQNRLNSKSDVGRALRIGDSVFCEKGAHITLRIGADKTLELDEHSGWYKIAPPDSPQFKRVLDAYGRTGGRDRGDFTVPVLYTPANESSVLPEQFVVRWSPLKQSCLVSLAIQDSNGREVWRQGEIDGASGSLSSTSASRSLVDYRENRGAGELQLKLSDSCGAEDRISFTLLSLTDQNALNRELAAWAGEKNPLMVHLGRASVFLEYEMFAEAAEEFDAALTLAPKSRSLLQQTIAAQRRTGNRERARLLEMRARKR
jgi:hypothetical protein